MLGASPGRSAALDQLQHALADLLAAQDAILRAPLLEQQRVVARRRVQPPAHTLGVAIGAILLERAERAELAVERAGRGPALVERVAHLADHEHLRRIAGDLGRL